MNADMRRTRGYYWTWQACSFVFACISGLATYLFLYWAGELNLIGGVIIGLAAAYAFSETRWRPGD